jgi:hypothetical protein
MLQRIYKPNPHWFGNETRKRRKLIQQTPHQACAEGEIDRPVWMESGRRQASEVLDGESDCSPKRAANGEQQREPNKGALRGTCLLVVGNHEFGYSSSRCATTFRKNTHRPSVALLICEPVSRVQPAQLSVLDGEQTLHLPDRR